MTHNAKSLAQQQFGAHAAGYVASPTHRAGYSLDRLIEWIAPRPGQRILDLATGGGHTALALARAGARVVAGDLTAPMLRAARAHIAAELGDSRSVTFVRLDAEGLPFPAAAFDAVTCRIAPHHFPDVARFVRECARAVRPGGLVGVVDQLAPPDPQTARYVNAFERLRDPSHVWAYNRAEWRGFFSAAGLEVVHYEEFDKEQALVAWAELMGCDGPTITRLRALLAQAPQPAAAWLRPQSPASADARFSIRQFLLVGRRAG
ncbi:MAG: methyltransferase domain-containing protein [Anaerolineae bacterium]|nr:methyltransferase domain-containing protein [Anaerolineae bacterium]